MGKTAVCTVSSQSHVFKARAMLLSAQSHSSADLFCLITDGTDFPKSEFGELYHGLDVLSSSLALAIKSKYSGDALRWSCKSLYMIFLLQSGYEKVIYVDNDIYFISSADFLFDELDYSSILLTPHFYPISIDKEQNWLEANFRIGLYNAGFVAASKDGVPALEWWASCCLYIIKQSAWRGLFDDQKYLDLLPVIFDHVKILKHKGCNVAGWNITQSSRSLQNDAVYIDGKWPLVFIHFAKLTVRNIMGGNDDALFGHFEKYVHALKQWNPQYTVESELKRGIKDYILYFRHVKWRITRLFE